MRRPTQMPEWLEKQFENAERTVQTWSEGKREAAGIPSSIDREWIGMEYTRTPKALTVEERWTAISSGNTIRNVIGVRVHAHDDKMGVCWNDDRPATKQELQKINDPNRSWFLHE